MSDNTDIVKKAADYIFDLFKGVPQTYLYHNLKHTEEVADITKKIAKKCDVSDSDMELLLLAAWFHDTGYTEIYYGHEDKSIELATNFLKKENYPEVRIEKVANLIAATKMPQHPNNLLEEIICDADLSHLGMKDSEDKSKLLRLEWEKTLGKMMSDVDWYQSSLDFMVQHKYYTKYARKEFDETKLENFVKLQKRLKKAVEANEEEMSRQEKMKFQREKLEVDKEKVLLKKQEDAPKDKEKNKQKKEGKNLPERGIETMFRNTIRTHVEFSAMADNKANIMISINTLILGIIVTTMLRKLGENPHLVYPTFMLLSVCLVCIIFGVMVTRPKVTEGTFTKDDIYKKKANLLFFGNFHKMELDDFNWGMTEMMNDKDYLYGSMISDYYFLGQVLGKKYRNLRICYNLFMYGMIAAVIAFTIAFVVGPPTTLELLGQ